MIINYPIFKESTLREYLESFYLSKSKIYTLFLENNILLNNHKAKETDIIKNGDTVQLILDEEIDYKINNDPIDIIYEDDYLLIINKPAGIIIHNEKENDDSLCNMVAGYYYNNGISLNIRFAHRLDLDTSGLIIFCKDILTLSYMSHFIETHDIKREYIAFVEGKFKNKKGTINLPIGRDRHENKMRVSMNSGKASITNYSVIKEYKNYSMVRLFLETGRTHQIRVHMSYNHHTLLGDLLYGGNDDYIDRCALHSNSVRFIHPVYLNEVYIEAKMPKDMNLLKK